MNAWKLSATCVAVFTFVAATGTARAQAQHGDMKPAIRSMPECPVTGEPIDFSVRVSGRDGPIFFCCKDCIKKYQSKPTQYAKSVAEQRKALAALPKVQVICPVSGKPVDEMTFINQGGKKVYFCCEGCIKKYRKDAPSFKSDLAESYTYQTKCPVMGEDINPKAFLKLAGGRKVFFCCDGCDKKFLKNPKKYIPNLEAQGIKIDPKVVKASDKEGKKEGEGHGSHDHEGHDH